MNMKKKNVMFLIGKMQTGGAEHVVYNLCNSLKDEYNITLVTRTMEGADYIPDVNTVEIPELGSKKKLFLGLKKLKKLKKKLKIDTSISFLLKYNIYNCLTKNKERVIISVRNNITSSKRIYSKTYIALYKKIINKVDLVVNVSATTMDDSIRNFGANRNKNIVIPNFCDYEFINSVKNEELPDEHRDIFKRDVIISNGRYNYQKGQWHLIRAFKNVASKNPNAVLVLTGRGSLKEYFEALVDELNLKDNVYILDYVDNVYRYMHHAKMFFLNSFYEGMPNVLLEAMACDLPVIATDAPGGSKEILEPSANISERIKEVTCASYGVLVPMCDGNMYSANDALTKEEEQLADAINMMLEDDKLYNDYKKISEQRVLDFSRDKILDMWRKII